MFVKNASSRCGQYLSSSSAFLTRCLHSKNRLMRYAGQLQVQQLISVRYFPWGWFSSSPISASHSLRPFVFLGAFSHLSSFSTSRCSSLWAISIQSAQKSVFQPANSFSHPTCLNPWTYSSIFCTQGKISELIMWVTRSSCGWLNSWRCLCLRLCHRLSTTMVVFSIWIAASADQAHSFHWLVVYHQFHRYA